MSSVKNILNKIANNKKANLFILISFFVVALVLGIKATYAYYHVEDDISILSNLVGDFDLGDGDVNVMIYKQNNVGKYVKTPVVPAIGYAFDDTKTTCTIECTNTTESNCYYVYSEANHTINLNSNQKVTCKFYFNKESSSDINIYIMKEDTNGTHTYSNRHYTNVNNVPAYGYVYSTIVCDNPTQSATYNSNTKTFNIQTATKNDCYAYFNEVGESDITTNVYVQSASGSSVYNKVDSIPSGNSYVLSVSRSSSCVNSSEVATGAVITYTDGYINIANTTEQQTCNIYLDLSSN
jgi:hypothetical protein